MTLFKQISLVNVTSVINSMLLFIGKYFKHCIYIFCIQRWSVKLSGTPHIKDDIIIILDFFLDKLSDFHTVFFLTQKDNKRVRERHKDSQSSN